MAYTLEAFCTESHALLKSKPLSSALTQMADKLSQLLANPDFVRFAESFGAAAERARTPDELRAALRRAFKRRDGPTLIEVPVGRMARPVFFSALKTLPRYQH